MKSNDQQVDKEWSKSADKQHPPDPGVYTVDDAIEKLGFGPFQVIVSTMAGMIWLADAMEVMLLAVLSPIVKCEWSLEPWQQALLTSVVFMGFMIGALCSGIISDFIGRKKSLIVIGWMVCAFGLLSSIAPNYVTLLVLRFAVGVGIGGGSQAVTYYLEFLAPKFRGICIVLMALWWSVGSILAAALALAIIPNLSQGLNWRIYLCLCAVPIGIVITGFLFMPESARYCLLIGKVEKAERILARVAWINGKSLPSGRLVTFEEKQNMYQSKVTENDLESTSETSLSNNHYEDDETSPLLKTSLPPNKQELVTTEHTNLCNKLKYGIIHFFLQLGSNIKSLFVNKLWRTTIPLSIIWVGCAWLYYGAVLLTTTILEKGENPSCAGYSNRSIDEGCNITLSTSFYVEIVWTSAAEIPGIILTMVFIDLIGRKITIISEFLATGVCIGLLLVCVPRTYIGLFLFGARGFVTGGFQAVTAYTPEVYPTKIRGSAFGMMTGVARIGALITPFIAQALFDVSSIATISLYLGSCAVLVLLTILLPIETKGRPLKDTAS